MCPPTHFEVSYSINPWMDIDVAVNLDLAVTQWSALKDSYERLGHLVETIQPVPGLPDMVFAANAGVVHNGRVLVANFTHPERQAEGPAYRRWFEHRGFSPVSTASEQNEGEGDVLSIGDLLLAGTGFRTSVAAHEELRRFFGVAVVTLDLVDPRFYHLDTALTVLDHRTIAYFPGAFSDSSVSILNDLFPDAILVEEIDACAFGLNAMSDGYNVVLSDRPVAFHEQLRDRGFNPIGVDTSELIKAGGSAKCATLELRV
jgi:N-dimethylarginine dimethylaminohydrolase